MIKNLLIVDRNQFDYFNRSLLTVCSVVLIVDEDKETFEVWKDRYDVNGKRQGKHFPLSKIKDCIGDY